VPRRDKFRQAFWNDDWTGLHGYPAVDPHYGKPRPTAAPAEPMPLSKRIAKAQERSPTPVDGVSVSYPEDFRPLPLRPPSAEWPKLVTLVMTDRLGFRYERVAGLNNYVSQREAALLLRLPVMTINRWVRAKTLRGTKRRGSSVVRLRDLLEVAIAKGHKLPVGKSIVVVGGSDPDKPRKREHTKLKIVKPRGAR
jgi:hypothetical protein